MVQPAPRDMETIQGKYKINQRINISNFVRAKIKKNVGIGAMTRSSIPTRSITCNHIKFLFCQEWRFGAHGIGALFLQKKKFYIQALKKLKNLRNTSTRSIYLYEILSKNHFVLGYREKI
jgi:hypothetical protein